VTDGRTDGQTELHRNSRVTRRAQKNDVNVTDASENIDQVKHAGFLLFYSGCSAGVGDSSKLRGLDVSGSQSIVNSVYICRPTGGAGDAGRKSASAEVESLTLD